MQDLIVFILIFAAIVFISSTPFLLPTQKAEIGQTQETSLEETPLEEEVPGSGTQTPSGPIVSTKPTAPKILVDTFIIGGPKEGQVIEEKTKITFKFEAKITPEQTGRIKFETKVVGLDTKWIKTSAKERPITLPSGPKEYTFLVRTLFNGLVDPTPAQRKFTANNSPLMGKVRIVSVKPRTTSRPSLIQLNTILGREEKIKLSGLRLEGGGGSFYIIKAVEKYHPDHSTWPNESIYANYGDIIYISGGVNPLGGGMNFRLNKCFGYLTPQYNFPISISLNCPKPTKDEISHFDPCCQEYINNLRKCEIPNIPMDLFEKCKRYLRTNFNYRGCFDNFSEDDDFLARQWHIYPGRDIVITDNCDTIYLRDNNGLFVHKFSYGHAICR